MFKLKNHHFKRHHWFTSACFFILCITRPQHQWNRGSSLLTLMLCEAQCNTQLWEQLFPHAQGTVWASYVSACRWTLVHITCQNQSSEATYLNHNSSVIGCKSQPWCLMTCLDSSDITSLILHMHTGHLWDVLHLTNNSDSLFNNSHYSSKNRCIL